MRTPRCSGRGFLAVLVLAPDLELDSWLAGLLHHLLDDGVRGDLVAGIDRVDVAHRDLAAIDPAVAEGPLHEFVEKGHLVLARGKRFRKAVALRNLGVCVGVAPAVPDDLFKLDHLIHGHLPGERGKPIADVQFLELQLSYLPHLRATSACAGSPIGLANPTSRLISIKRPSSSVAVASMIRYGFSRRIYLSAMRALTLIRFPGSGGLKY